jgi:NAD(P)-dependent dehydrogenase (short-subunit alcohol dehydrogenase family)
MIDKEIEEIGSRLHMKGRIIEPAEVADAIYLLSLPEASAINGSTVMVDDGYASFKGVDGYQA